MSPERLLKYFEEISEAPDAVLRLRRFFWDLAVRGKLVEQDPKDEPAAVLLKQIETEKKGSINRSKGATIAMQPIRIDEMPFDLPYGWLWLRFGAIHDLVRGVTYSKNDVSEEPTPEHLPILRANNIGPSLNFEDLVFVRKECIGPDQFLRQGDYMIALSSGSKNLVGKAAYAEEDFKGGFGGFCGVIRLSSPLLRPYTGIFLSSHLYRDALSEGSRGIGINNLKKETLSKVLFPLPPLAEQHRIVAKVDELTALCDELEMAKQKRERRRDRLVAATLNALNNGDGGSEPRNRSEFEENALFYFNHLPRLTTRPEHIQQLRQTILNLAVRGKLVPQDARDEPVSGLLKSIEIEKARLVNEGKVRKQRPLPVVEAGEVPFQIPEKWNWVRLVNVAALIGGYAYQSDSYVKHSSNQIIRLGNVKNNALLLNQKPVFIPDLVANNTLEFQILPKDILITMTGTKAKRDYAFTVAVNESYFAESRLFLNQRVGAIRPFICELVPLLNIFLKTDALLDVIFAAATGTANQGNIGAGDVLGLPIPLPPVGEQHRIVAKVDELMAICDELESRLSTTATTRHQLLEATLSEAMAQ